LGVNVIFDATMRSSGTSDRLAKEYRELGYTVDGYFMHTAPQISATRALNRFMRTGRFVPPEYTLSSTSNEKTFDKAVPSLRKWAVYDNNSGTGPVKVAEGSN
jgi:hypothetical protein